MGKASAIDVKQGSPPRVRGKEPTRRQGRAKRRITPACAGKSPKIAGGGSVRQDHPRVCGEKKAYKDGKEEGEGSPPRVRGKVLHCKPAAASMRITPAHAGKRIKLRKRHSICGDHPRACGEKTMRFIIASTVSGSPPRVRGKEKTPVGHLPDLGITPAYAGKRWRGFARCQNVRDHPRVCGEK